MTDDDSPYLLIPGRQTFLRIRYRWFSYCK